MNRRTFLKVTGLTSLAGFFGVSVVAETGRKLRDSESHARDSIPMFRLSHTKLMEARKIILDAPVPTEGVSIRISRSAERELMRLFDGVR